MNDEENNNLNPGRGLGRGLESLIPSSRPGSASAQNPKPQAADPDPSSSAPTRPQPASLVSNTHFVSQKEEKKEGSKPEEIKNEPSEFKPQPEKKDEDWVAKFAAERAAEIKRKEIEKIEKEKADKNPTSIFHIEVEKIKPNPDQPRKVFDEDALHDLAASIREFGLLQPIVVTKVEHEVPLGTEVEYILISGERRLLAVKKLGWERIPAIIRNVSLEKERLELAIIENIQREQLNPVETARAMARLQDEFRMTQREIAARLGKSREVVANAVRLLDLPMEIQEALEKGQISESHGRLLLTIEDPALQVKLFRDLIDNKLSTRELKIKVKTVKPEASQAGGRPENLSPELKMLQEKLSQELGAPVFIQRHGDTGKITISFYSGEELQNLINKLAGEEDF